MRTITAFAVILIGNCLLPSLEAKDIIKDKSPDGKFALQISRTDEGWWSAEIVGLKSEDVVFLEIYQNMVEGVRLVWSKDSERVAYFEPDRRGGSTHIYFRNGSNFDEVEYPDVPECSENPNAQGSATHFKTTDATSSPKEWLKSGALVVAVEESWLTDDENGHHCSETVTIAFDANRKASIESVKNKKIDHE
jgi:hypothetical protein